MMVAELREFRWLSKHGFGSQFADSLYRLIWPKQKNEVVFVVIANSLKVRYIHNINLFLFSCENTKYERIIRGQHERRLISLGKASSVLAILYKLSLESIT